MVGKTQEPKTQEAIAGEPAPAGKPSAEPSAASVARYLELHPDFLLDQPELLDRLNLPSAERQGDVVDLRQVLLERTRREAAELRQSTEHMVETLRGNQAVQGRVQQAVLALMRATSLEQLVEVVTAELPIILNLDVVTLCVERSDTCTPEARRANLYPIDPGMLDAVIGPDRRLHLSAEDVPPQIFGAGSGLVQSYALVRLEVSDQAPPAVLALGSRDAEHFEPGQGTDLLQFLGDALESAIQSWLVHRG